ncbi:MULTISPECIES: RimK/LysX family protein [unclassified Imperialibacter]|uniref:ATP-dependent zinc protease family protein n=1 Tax=unclassified Imperialibacter TaxID=2629706 RepID=UPI00125F2CC1|nr:MULTISPECIES: RimK/LysX family protein [unclassified Imperialibacter]
MKSSYTIGRNDIIDLPELDLFNIKAKIDTGAFTSALHCSRIKVSDREGTPIVSFQISGATIGRKGSTKFETSDFTQRKIKSSTGHIENRVIIKTRLVLFGKKFRTEFSLTDRSGMKFPVLLGRKFLKKGFVVDVREENLSFKMKIAQ